MTDEQMRAFMTNVRQLEDEMKAGDTLVYSGRLKGSKEAKVVSVGAGEALTTDGPFAETKEQLGGFYIIRAADFDEALRWAQRTSDCVGKPIEVRPFAAISA
jgi:hypothetical protein